MAEGAKNCFSVVDPLLQMDVTSIQYTSFLWTPKTHGKMKVLGPQNMGEITPKHEGFTWVPMVPYTSKVGLLGLPTAGGKPGIVGRGGWNRTPYKKSGGFVFIGSM